MKTIKKIATLLLMGSILICGTDFEVFAAAEELTREVNDEYKSCYEQDVHMNITEEEQYFEVYSDGRTIRWEAQKVDDAVYAETDCYIRKESPNIESTDEKLIPQGTEVHRVGLSPNGWDLVELDREIYFVWYSCLTEDAPASYNTWEPAYDASKFQSMGVINWNGYRWTYYSQRVLPGGGLKIPGRHVGAYGFVCDENEYIVLASTTVAYGTVVETPFGMYGKVYDSGCAYGVMDCYCDW